MKTHCFLLSALFFSISIASHEAKAAPQIVHPTCIVRAPNMDYRWSQFVAQCRASPWVGGLASALEYEYLPLLLSIATEKGYKIDLIDGPSMQEYQDYNKKLTDEDLSKEQPETAAATELTNKTKIKTFQEYFATSAGELFLMWAAQANVSQNGNTNHGEAYRSSASTAFTLEQTTGEPNLFRFLVLAAGNADAQSTFTRIKKAGPTHWGSRLNCTVSCCTSLPTHDEEIKELVQEVDRAAVFRQAFETLPHCKIGSDALVLN